MTGIEKLRELSKGMHNHRMTVWQLTDDAYEERFGVTKHGPTIKNFLSDIADQIERELDKVATTDWETVRDVADDMARKVFGIDETDAMIEEYARRLDDALDGRKRCVHDPAADVSMSAYDLLPADERDAIAWVREHGGLEEVEALWSGRVPLTSVKRMVELHKSKRERLKAHISSLERVCAERRDKIIELRKTIAEMRPRLMPEDYEWPRYESGERVERPAVPAGDGEPVEVGQTVWHKSGLACGVVETIDAGSLMHTTRYRGDDGTIYRDAAKDLVHKRPTPKALDADGVEIRVGDTVWDMGGNGPYEVVRFTEHGYVRIKSDFGLEQSAFCERLTHRAPVLAADGKPLREGETVYELESGDELIAAVLYEAADRLSAHRRH